MHQAMMCSNPVVAPFDAQFLTCLKNTFPLIERPHFSHRLVMRACCRKHFKCGAGASPAVRSKSIESRSQTCVSRLKRS